MLREVVNAVVLTFVVSEWLSEKPGRRLVLFARRDAAPKWPGPLAAWLARSGNWHATACERARDLYAWARARGGGRARWRAGGRARGGARAGGRAGSCGGGRERPRARGRARTRARARARARASERA